ncbi:cation transport regulator ChaC [Rhizobium leguminosarum]
MIPGLACDMDEFWVFGYGSLMWNPGFEFMERAEALVYGYRRSLCVRSFVHRGTRDNPGLVLGLDRGGRLPRHGFPHFCGKMG